MKYKSNNNIVYSCKYHVVFCPKYRRKVLNNGVDERLIVQKIDRYYPSSQICHVCGTKNPETKNLAVREWICAKCKTSHDRDRNAAINIWKVGASTFFGEI